LNIDVNTLNFTGHSSFVYTLTILSNGDVVSGSHDKKIKVWNSTTGVLKHEFIDYSSAILALDRFSNDDIVSGEEDGSIRVCNSTDGRIKLNFTTNYVYSLKTLSNGDIVS
jgi:phospholipase A-2-activating protein